MCAITSHLRVNSGNFPRVVATHVEAYSGVSGHIANNSGSIFRQISVISQHCRRQVIIMGGVHSRRTGPGKIDKERCKLKICCLTFQMTFDIVLTSFVIYHFSTTGCPKKMVARFFTASCFPLCLLCGLSS